MKLWVYLGGLSASETTEADDTKTVSLRGYLAVYRLPWGVKCHRLSDAGPATNNEPIGEQCSPAGDVPAHVHCFAWVDVLGTVSAEFLLRAVTDADRWDLALALLLFRQVFSQRKQVQPLCPAYMLNNTDFPLKTEEKSISLCRQCPGWVRLYDRWVGGQPVSKRMCSPISSIGLCSLFKLTSKQTAFTEYLFSFSWPPWHIKLCS